tara:strand:- start:196 stop:1317 length:1122 start_codon:yes stop_codon:yes gene_type:complete
MTRVNSTGKESLSNFSPDNGTGSAVRTAMKNIFESLRTVNSAAGDPSGPENLAAYQLHIDSDTDLLKIRNGANSAFVTLGNVSQTNFGFLSTSGGTLTGVLGASAGSASTPSLNFGDSNTGLFKKATNQIGITTAGTEQLFLDQEGITLNAQNELRFKDSDSSNFAAIKAPSSIGANYTLTLPTSAGSNGQFLKVGSSGALSFASELEVTKIIPTGGVASGAGGGIIQVVTAHTNSKTTTKATTYQDISGLSLTIEPLSSTSKILIFVNLTFSHTNGGDAGIFSLARIVGGTTARPAESGIGTGGTNQLHNGLEDEAVFSHSAHFLDSPNTTDPINYKYQVKHYVSHLGDLIIGGRSTDMPQTMNLTAMEVSA